MSIVTDNTKTLENALAIIETLEIECAQLITSLNRQRAENERLRNTMKKIGTINVSTYCADANIEAEIKNGLYDIYIAIDVYDAAGFLITPEVKIEQ